MLRSYTDSSKNFERGSVGGEKRKKRYAFTPAPAPDLALALPIGGAEIGLASSRAGTKVGKEEGGASSARGTAGELSSGREENGAGRKLAAGQPLGKEKSVESHDGWEVLVDFVFMFGKCFTDRLSYFTGERETHWD